MTQTAQAVNTPNNFLDNDRKRCDHQRVSSLLSPILRHFLAQHWGGNAKAELAVRILERHHYWQNKIDAAGNHYGMKHGERIWIYKTNKNYAQELGISKRTYERAKSIIPKNILLISPLSRYRDDMKAFHKFSDRTNYYSLSYPDLHNLLASLESKNECLKWTGPSPQTRRKAHSDKNRRKSKKHDFDAMVLTVEERKINKLNLINKGMSRKFSTKKKNVEPKVSKVTNKRNRTLAVIFASNDQSDINGSVTHRSVTSPSMPVPVMDATKIKSKTQTVVKSPEKVVEAQKKHAQTQLMRQDWNKIVGPVGSTPQKEYNTQNALLGKARVEIFKNEEEWRHYCRLVASSSFLTAKLGGDSYRKKPWRLLTWVLDFKNIQRILNGEMGVKLSGNVISEKVKTLEESNLAANDHIEKIDEPKAAKQKRCEILDAVGPRDYNTWMTKVAMSLDGQTLHPCDLFVKKELENRPNLWRMREAFEILNIVIGDVMVNPIKQETINSHVAQPYIATVTSSLQLDRDSSMVSSYGNFHEGDLETALATVEASLDGVGADLCHDEHWYDFEDFERVTEKTTSSPPVNVKGVSLDDVLALAKQNSMMTTTPANHRRNKTYHSGEATTYTADGTDFIHPPLNELFANLLGQVPTSMLNEKSNTHQSLGNVKQNHSSPKWPSYSGKIPNSSSLFNVVKRMGLN